MNFSWRTVNNTAKGIMLIFILFLAWGIAEPFLANAPASTETVKSEKQIAGDGIFTDFLKGNWIFGNSEWNFAVDQKFEASEFLAKPQALRDRHDEFDDQETIDFFEMMGGKDVSKEEGWKVLVSKGAFCEQVMFVRNGVVQLLRTRLGSGRQGTVVEAYPTKNAVPVKSDLMPLPNGCRQVAMRVIEDRVCAAILESPNGLPSAAIEYWQDQGWQVEYWQNQRWQVDNWSAQNLYPGSHPQENESGFTHQFHQDGKIVEATFLPNETGYSVVLARLR